MTAPIGCLDGEQAIRDALAEGPTSGPWVANNNEGYSLWTIWSRMTPSGNGTPGPMIAQVIGDSAEADANAALVAACNPETMRALLAELDRLRSASRQEGKTDAPNPWADCWYFVMDEAPLEFERIVTTYPPARWHDEAHKLMRAKHPHQSQEAQGDRHDE